VRKEAKEKREQEKIEEEKLNEQLQKGQENVSDTDDISDKELDEIENDLKKQFPTMFVEELQQQMESMKREQEFLKDLVVRSIQGSPESQKNANKYKSLLRKALMDMLNKISNFDFDHLINDITKQHGLDHLYNLQVEYNETDKKGSTKVRKSNFFYTRFWSNKFDQTKIIDSNTITEVMRIMIDPQKLEAAEFLNRVKRGEKNQLKYGFTELMSKIRGFTNVYVDLLDKLEEEELK
jgi:hypothetical protein